MRFLPAIDLWSDSTQRAVLSGQLKLQTGQWVSCGGEHKSRFVGISQGGTIVAAHYNGSAAAQTERFNDLKTALGKMGARA